MTARGGPGRAVSQAEFPEAAAFRGAWGAVLWLRDQPPRTELTAPVLSFLGLSWVPRREGTHLIFLFMLETCPAFLILPLPGWPPPSPVPLVPSQGELGEIGLDGLDGEDVSDLALSRLVPVTGTSVFGGHCARDDVLSLSLAGRQRSARLFRRQGGPRETGMCVSRVVTKKKTLNISLRDGLFHSCTLSSLSAKQPSLTPSGGGGYPWHPCPLATVTHSITWSYLETVSHKAEIEFVLS